MTLKCPKCQFDNISDSKFCKECGTSLLSSIEAKASITQTFETPSKELTRGTLIADRYEIIEELGSGGMGKVFRAEDTEIHEDIALKVIKPEIASDKKTIERFNNELRIARKITHKNVCRMYHLGEAKGTYFITMEYIPGENLKSFIKRSGKITIETSITIAKQICRGLSEAHNSGIIHRDLKSSNIMIDKQGNARIMDFGIAHSLESQGLTDKGIIIGSFEYMSPEQAEGKDIDQRSDIYSMGVILYEAVTGQLPFKGDSITSLLMMHKNELPRNPDELNPRIPKTLCNLILKCLEKNKDKRFQNIQDLHDELTDIEKDLSGSMGIKKGGEPSSSKGLSRAFNLKKLLIPIFSAIILVLAVFLFRFLFQKSRTGSVEQPKISIAVLPFNDHSLEKELGWICEGLAETLISGFTNIEQVIVRPSTSSFYFRDRNDDNKDIAKKLKVDFLLYGNVMILRNRLQINVDLIDVENEAQIWSEQYMQTSEDFLDIQDDIKILVLEKLPVDLQADEKQNLRKRSTESVEANNLYMKGNHHLREYTPEGMRKAEEYFTQALQHDQDYALAYLGLARLYIRSTFWGYNPPNESVPKSKEYLNKALDRDEKLGEAYAVLGFIYAIFDRDYIAAEEEFKKALQLNPNSALTHYYYSFLLTHMERHKQAIAESKRAWELDPLSSNANAFLGQALIWAKQYDQAVDVLHKTIELYPNLHVAHYFLGLAYTGKNMLDEAGDAFNKSVELSNELPWTIMVLTCNYYMRGKNVQGEELFEKLRQRLKTEYIPPLAFFYIHLLRNDMDQALLWLEQSFEERDSFLGWVLVSPIEALKIPDTPKFKATLHKYGVK